MSIVVAKREVRVGDRRRRLYVSRTLKGWVLESYALLPGGASSLDRRRYFYGPDAEKRALNDMASYHDETEAAIEVLR